MHEIYLQRCCDLANLADASVSPNPRVGSVLLAPDGRVIGEGYHRQHGTAHAEVNCLASVAESDRHLICESTLYVSLEPCCIFGRTPPCTNLILENNIPRVVVGQRDLTAEVSGRGLDILRRAGVSVIEIPNFQPAARIVAPRQLFAAQQRPFVLLKYAVSADGFMAPANKSPYWITGPMSRRLTHYWRSRTGAILIGAGTLLADNPALTTRLYPGPSPLPVVIDPNGKIQGREYKLFERPHGGQLPLLFQPLHGKAVPGWNHQTIDFSALFSTDFGWQSSQETAASKPQNDAAAQDTGLKQTVLSDLLLQVLKVLHEQQINHLTVEGGRWLLESFLSAKLWDEARVLTASGVYYGSGLSAPKIELHPGQQSWIGKDRIDQYYPTK